MQSAQCTFICPQTRQPLREATSGELAALRKLPGQNAMEAAWISQDSSTAYPVQNGIPQLIPSAAIAIPNFPSPHSVISVSSMINNLPNLPSHD